MNCDHMAEVVFNNKLVVYIVAPSLIVYDNSCNLHSYCLNRDPGFFRQTKFVVDRFHWRNHRGKFDYLFLFLLCEFDAVVSY